MDFHQFLGRRTEQCKVYLNGELVHRSTQVRPVGEDQDVIAGITLRNGTNVVVFKVVNEGGDWGGCLRFCDKHNKPMTDFEAKLEP
jgi:hypothetical protein